jgi:trans-aconitate methyltransferase
MKQQEMIALIRAGVAGGTPWADLGAGTGNFTRALQRCLPAGATLYAVDKNARALRQAPPGVQTLTADFSQPLDLPPLAGILMANALHWVGRQQAVLENLRDALQPAGRLLVVEYDVRRPRAYIPFPIGTSRFRQLAHKAGFGSIETVGRRVSPSSGIAMVALLARLPPCDT